ncbi:MAG: ELWxxDGT repeat protein, partial [Planctomycetaceae bacterium]
RANDGLTGYELWQSDGTSTGTVLVRDIRSGTNSSSLWYLTNVNGTLYFTANDGTTGIELWQSDGTSAGTVRVRDIRSGGSNSSPQNLTNVNGTLYFRANDGLTGYELWKSDGPSAGAVRVRDIRSGGSASSSTPRYLTNVNGTLYFTANDGTTGIELWKSDGTSAGTVRVLDIRSGDGTSSSSPANLTNVNGALYFRANDGTTGIELWKSDGTSDGTVRVRDIRSGGGSSYPSSLTNVNGTLYFRASDGLTGYELWQSDGTSTGTVLVRDIRSSLFGSYPQFLTNVNGTLYFQAIDGTTGLELWKSDGTSTGTVRVQDIRSGDDTSNSSPAYLTNVNGTLYFSANDGITGAELWKAISSSSNPGAASLSLGGQTDAATYGSPADTVTFVSTATRTSTGTFEGSYSVSGLPAGVSSSFSTTTFTSTGDNPLSDSTLSLTVGATVAAGSYPFTVSLLNTTAGGSDTIASGTLIVNQAALTVTPTAGQSKIYGTSDPTFTYAVAGLMNSDTAASAITGGDLGRAAGETVASGPYAYTLGTLAANSNYILSLGVGNSFAITARSITGSFTANGKIYDASTTASVDIRTANDVELGDDVSLTGGTATFDDENAGTDKTVTLGGATLSGADAGNYSLASVGTTTASITPATATVSVVDYYGVYDGNSHTASVSITGVGGVELASASVTGTNVMDSGMMAWAFTMDSNYEYADGIAYLTITPATATVSVVHYYGVYDGNEHTASVTITGVGGVELASNWLTAANVMDSGMVDASVMDSNYEPAYGIAYLTIIPAAATVSVVDYYGVYDGNEHTASVTITGVGGVELASNWLTAANVMDSGMVYASVMDSNYEPAYGTATLSITQATLAVDVTGYTGGTYDSTEKTQSVAVTGVGADGLLFADSLTGTNVGSYSKDWSYSNPNYEAVSGTLAFTITNETPTDITLSATFIAE